jgi:peptidoglycan/LPS O-acetylase OafA/YrhL
VLGVIRIKGIKMNIYALTIGIITAILIIWHFKRRKLEKSKLPYPILLATFPLYYFVFALYSSDYVALYKEIGVGFIFLVLALLAIKSNRKASSLLVAIGCIAHGIYDAYHNMLFINNGTPSWWLEFCGSIDIILGIYLIYFAVSAPNKAFKNDRQKATVY